MTEEKKDEKKVAEKKRGRVRRLIKKIDKKQPEHESEKKWDAKKTFLWAIGVCVWAGVMYFVAQWVVFSVAGWIIDLIQVNNNGYTPNLMMAQSVCTLISDILALALIIALPRVVFKKYKTSRDELGLHGLPTWTDVLLGPIGYILSMIAAVIVVLAMSAIAPSIDWNQAQNVGYNGLYFAADKAAAFLVLVVLTPIVEELVFRGWVYGKLRGRMSAVPAIILVSLLFAIMHGQINVGVIVFVMSVFMCIARELTGTIYAGIIIHMLRNGVAFYLLYITPFGGGASSAMLPALMAFLV